MWLPREDILTFEEAAGLVDVFTDLGVDKVRLTGGEPLLRNGLERLVKLARRQSAAPRPRHHHQRHPPRRAGVRAPRGRPPSRHGEPRHAATGALQGPDPPGGPPAGARGDRVGGSRGIPRAQARYRGHARHQRGRAGGPDRVRARGARRDPLHRVHGRGRRHALDPRAGRFARRDARGAGPALRRHRAPERGWLRARRSLPAPRRLCVRNHRLHHGALLPGLRPEPPHRRRDVVPLPLRHPGHRSAEGAPRGRVTGRPSGT